MKLYHPFQAVPAHLRVLVGWPLVAFWLLLSAVQVIVNAPLYNAEAPRGIVSLELAGGVEAARRVLASWDPPTRLLAGHGLVLDYLCLLSYSTAGAYLCVCAAEAVASRSRSLAMLGFWLAWGEWVAGLLDGIENASLLVILNGPVTEPWPAVARWCAMPKFVLGIGGLAYMGVAWGAAYLLGGRNGDPSARGEPPRPG